MGRKIRILLFFLIFLAGCSNGKIEEKRDTTIVDLLNDEKSIISCDLNIWPTITAEEDENWRIDTLSFNGNQKESKPLQIIITDIASEEPKLKGNADEVELIKLPTGNPDTVYMLEETGFWNITLWTFFKKQKILVMSKQYYNSLGGYIYATQMAWFCK